MSAATNTNKKFNKSLAALWATSNGGFISMPVDAQVFDNLQAVEKGAKLVIKIVNNRPKETSPHAYLELISKEDVAAYTNRRGPRAAPAPASDDI